jgi:chromosome partitioning protein
LAWAKTRQQSRQDGDIIKSTPAELASHIKHARASGFDMCIVDTPPRADADIPRLLGLADLIVIPLRPSMPDLAASQIAFSVAKDSGQPFIVIINAAHPRSTDVIEAREALTTHYTVAPTTIHQRTAFARALASGQAVSEFEPHGKATQEITEIWSYLKSCL